MPIITVPSSYRPSVSVTAAAAAVAGEIALGVTTSRQQFQPQEARPRSLQSATIFFRQSAAIFFCRVRLPYAASSKGALSKKYPNPQNLIYMFFVLYIGR
jgi:hypothetical protein